MTLPHEDEIVEQSGGPWLGIAIIIAVIVIIIGGCVALMMPQHAQDQPHPVATVEHAK